MNTQELSRVLEPEFENGVPRVIRTENLNLVDTSEGIIYVTTTLCPLYAQGSLGQSSLIEPGQRIEASRVACKLAAFNLALKNINELARQQGLSTHAILTFADRGVITQEAVHDEVLDYHEQLYQQSAQGLSSQGISWSWQKYSNLHPGFPKYFFTKPVSASGLSLEGRLEQASDQLEFNSRVINSKTGDLNKRGRKIINSLVNACGTKIGMDLLMQYGIFDAATTMPGCINLFLERGELLLNVTNLFAHRNNPRIDILC